MSLVEIKDGYKEPTGRSNKDGYEFKRVFVLTNPDTSDGMEYRILTDPNLPKYGDPYPLDSNLKVSEISVENPNDSNFFFWTAEVTYKVPDEDESTDPTQGFKRDLRVTARSQQYEVPFDAAYDNNNNQYDSNGNVLIPVVSTSKEKLLVSKYDSNVIIDISQNVSRFDFDWISQYKNSTNANKTSIVGIKVDVDQARILDITASNQVDSTGDTYYSSTISIEITDKDFKIRPINEGRTKRENPQSAETSATVAILKRDIIPNEPNEDIANQPVDEAVRLTKQNDPYTNSEAGAIYLEFKAYPSLNWSVLDIPTSQP